MHLVITALNGMWNGNGPYESGLELGGGVVCQSTAAVPCSYVALPEVEPAKRSLVIRSSARTTGGQAPPLPSLMR